MTLSILKATLKTYKSLFLANKFSNEQYFGSFYLVLVIQEIIGNGWKRNLYKTAIFIQNVYSTGKFMIVTGNSDRYFSSISKPFLIEFPSYQKLNKKRYTCKKLNKSS